MKEEIKRIKGLQKYILKFSKESLTVDAYVLNELSDACKNVNSIFYFELLSIQYLFHQNKYFAERGLLTSNDIAQTKKWVEKQVYKLCFDILHDLKEKASDFPEKTIKRMHEIATLFFTTNFAEGIHELEDFFKSSSSYYLHDFKKLKYDFNTAYSSYRNDLMYSENHEQELDFKYSGMFGSLCQDIAMERLIYKENILSELENNFYQLNKFTKYLSSETFDLVCDTTIKEIEELQAVVKNSNIKSEVEKLTFYKISIQEERQKRIKGLESEKFLIKNYHLIRSLSIYLMRLMVNWNQQEKIRIYKSEVQKIVVNAKKNVALGNVEHALLLIKGLVEDNFPIYLNQVVSISGRYSNLSRNDRLEVLDYSQKFHLKSKLIKALLLLIEELEKNFS